jgi:peroxiredoxin
LALLGALAVCPASATSPVPRKSPELVIAEASGKAIRLSALTGKVVVLEFLVTNCPHCFRVAQTISKLQWEMGKRGLQSIGIAFDKKVDAQTVTNFTGKLAITYPVGYLASDKVDTYLGRTGEERFRLPQIVVIDRKGVIRAQSQPNGEKKLEDENYLRGLIDGLLKES